MTHTAGCQNADNYGYANERHGMSSSEAKRIVLTGGPCSGKSSSLSYLYEHLVALGYRVVLVPEAATLVYGATGRTAAERTPAYNRASQEGIIHVQHVIGEALARSLPDDSRPIVYLYDRAELDGRAYLGRKSFDEMLMRVTGKTAQEIAHQYDAVIHLVTAAADETERSPYTTRNNEIRLETPEQARKQDRKTQRAWLGHPHLVVVPNEGSFDDKLRRTLRAVLNVLGEPEPVEIEKKWLLTKVPDVSRLKALPVSIRQTYLQPNRQGETLRVRARTVDDHTTYYKTVKQDTDRPGVKLEYEAIISQDAYESLLGFADPNRTEIVKTRWVFTYRGQHFELDHFHAPRDLWVLEAELVFAEDWIELPEAVLGPLKDITGDKRYSNRRLSKI